MLIIDEKELDNYEKKNVPFVPAENLTSWEAGCSCAIDFIRSISIDSDRLKAILKELKGG